MRIDWWTLGLQTINLLVLLWLLGRFLFRPMAAIVAQRQAEAAKLLDDARAAQDDARAATQVAKDEQDRTIAARDAVVEQARKDGEAERVAMIAAGRKEIAAQQLAASAAIAQERTGTQARLEEEAGQLATDIAARLLAPTASALPLDAFLSQLGQALAALPQATRVGIGAGDAPVALTSAQALDEAARTAVTAAISRALDRPVKLAFSVDPGLLAGLRLSDDMAQVDANLRADLDRVQVELTHHDA